MRPSLRIELRGCMLRLNFKVKLFILCFSVSLYVSTHLANVCVPLGPYLDWLEAQEKTLSLRSIPSPCWTLYWKQRGRSDWNSVVVARRSVLPADCEGTRMRESCLLLSLSSVRLCLSRLEFSLLEDYWVRRYSFYYETIRLTELVEILFDAVHSFSVYRPYESHPSFIFPSFIRFNEPGFLSFSHFLSVLFLFSVFFSFSSPSSTRLPFDWLWSRKSDNEHIFFSVLYLPSFSVELKEILSFGRPFQRSTWQNETFRFM